jgi:hypothetical protein
MLNNKPQDMRIHCATTSQTVSLYYYSLLLKPGCCQHVERAPNASGLHMQPLAVPGYTLVTGLSQSRHKQFTKGCEVHKPCNNCVNCCKLHGIALKTDLRVTKLLYT